MTDYTARAIVRAEYPIATEPFQSTEETRYYLNGCSIAAHAVRGAEIVTTDGHMMACVWDPEAIVLGAPSIWGVPWKKMLQQVMRTYESNCPKSEMVDKKFFVDLTYGKGPSRVRLVVAETAQQVLDGEGDEVFNQAQNKAMPSIWIDGTFPEWRRVLPCFKGWDSKPFQPHCNAYNAKYIAKAAVFAAAITDMFDEGGAGLMTIVHGEEGGPAMIRTSRENAFLIIMPIRSECATGWENARPDWLDDVLMKTAAEIAAFEKSDAQTQLPKAA